MKVIAKDLDGNKNGIYEKDSIELSFTQKDQITKGSGSWYSGVYKKTNQNFKLVRTEVIPMYGVMASKYDEKEEK